MHRLRRFVPGLLLSLMLPGAAFAQLTIEGRIRTADGKRLPENMTVLLLGDMYQHVTSTRVDPGGLFRFDVPSRQYYIQVETAGSDYEGQTVRFEPHPNPFSRGGRETQLVDIVLKLRASVKQAIGQPAPGSQGSVFAQAVPPAARKAYDKAAESLQKDKQAEAIASLKKALEAFPEYFDALEALGSEYVRQRNFAEAIPLLRQAVQVNDAGPRAHYALGVALAETGQREPALQELRRAVELGPDSPNANMRLGVELAKDPKSQQEAIAQLEKVALLAGKDIPDAYFYLASLYSKQQKYKEAADALEKYAAAVPNSSPEQKAQYEKAIRQLREKAR